MAHDKNHSSPLRHHSRNRTSAHWRWSSGSAHPNNTSPSNKGTSSSEARTEHSNSEASLDSKAQDSVAERIKQLYDSVQFEHAQVVAAAIDSTKATERRVFEGVDLFAGLSDPASPVSAPNGSSMRIKAKQHGKSKKDGRNDEYFTPIPIHTNKERVPRYRFHHTDINKNLLTANTMLTFVPHLRDLESNEEKRYNMWLQELEEIDRKSGFKPMNRDEKYTVTIQTERAAQISLWLNHWLEVLAIPHCNKAALMLYLIPQFSDDALPDKHELYQFYASGLDEDKALRAAKFFVGALDMAFNKSRSHPEHIDLRKVLRLYTHSMTRSYPKEEESHEGLDEDEIANRNLATYSDLGCLICFSHACQHGEYNDMNYKCNFSISSRDRNERLRGDLIFQKKRHFGIQQNPAICHRECHREPNRFELNTTQRTWTEDEVALLRSVLVAAEAGGLERDRACFVADLLDRYCSDVQRKLENLELQTMSPEIEEPRIAKTLPWYDRHRKLLLGDWQDHTIAHEHQQRDWFEPCFHQGPCDQNCPCVIAGILCEKYCRCTVEECSYKFTGCACQSLGKICQAKQKDRACVCVLLNRECDPDLCGSCGAIERADAANAHVELLHTTGCQNCDLQRGVPKTVSLGKSQLDGVGFGLFAAEGISQYDFVIEYVGELITHDEGVRREARRGDVFSETSNISYVFTLLEKEGIWVDAAMGGNLSRYINHAVERCNITPEILYVNGEYRIKFSATRDIDAGEELFFNYGENFPNLTKKLLDTKTGHKSVFTGKRIGRPRRSETGDDVARKQPEVIPATKAYKQTKYKRQKISRLRREIVPDSADESQSYDTPVRDDDSQLDSLAEQMSVEQDVARKTVTPIRQSNSPMTDRSRRTLKRKREDSHDLGSERETRDMSKASTPLRQGHDLASMPPESAAVTDQDGSVTNSPSADRMTTRRSNRVGREIESPARRDNDKTRGKRGGARPGSGRPRKYPKNASRANASTEEASVGNDDNARSTRRTSRNASGKRAIVISDSEDDGSVSRQFERGRNNNEALDEDVDQDTSDSNADEEEISGLEADEESDSADARDYEDDEEEEEETRDNSEIQEQLAGEDGEDEEEPEMTPVGLHRSLRRRRLPAKFRDDSL